MQFSLLNKTITFILVGSIFLGIVGFYYFEELLGTNSSLASVSESIGANTLVLISIAMGAGVILDAATDVSVRLLLSFTAFSNSRLAKIITVLSVQTNMRDRSAGWRQAFNAQQVGLVSKIHTPGTTKHDIPDYAIASALFHGNAPKHQFDWAASHHSAYLLASNLFMLVGFSLIIGCLQGYGSIGFVTIHLAISWLLYSIALDRLLYTYTYAFRSVVLETFSKEPDQHDPENEYE